ncbi:hypothetical protein [Bradyrhizobium sp. AUGA SZCCT0160]|uniref:hypothetical protein n=1 Tax=Bradyrhizobium sp. AUGA SZCCT0160 TaxID=2807662 RepID=UPI001BA53A34|nr:hypothetical protein [Bradyrhizobium sp. AUGA SZCCT0160]MBR1190077.1 hypothetical protein [Bradyrhizobium sp. AUGA SZCCT0160]
MSAQRQRRYRLRLAGGVATFRIKSDPDDMRVALQGSGVLPPGEHEREAIERALQEQINDWVAGWAALKEA